MDYDPLPDSTCRKRSWWQWIIICSIPLLLIYGFIQYRVAPKPEDNTPVPLQSEKPAAVSQTIIYSGTAFSPDTLTIKKGVVVTFINGSGAAMRIASNPHPIHDAYPTRGGCISSTFDSCKDIAPGQSWSFTFDVGGTWSYHDHLRPNVGGTIIVQ